jgi:preprotein translocase subunit SecF
MIKVVEKKYLWFLLSLIVISIGVITVSNRALKSEPLFNLGIDFLGGNSYILKFEHLENEYLKAIDTKENINLQFIESLRQNLVQFGMSKSTLQVTNNGEVLIKTLLMKRGENQAILKFLREKYGPIEVLEIDFIGPSIGIELKEKSIAIILFVSLALLAYISLRFKLKYGVAALIALTHDTLITLTFTALLNIEINTAYVAALLTILGYSINDTIVIFDRIRENNTLYHHSKSQNEIINSSIMQTMRRTINTSLTTLMVILSLLFFGGITIKSFTIVLLIGVLAGTYSSVFIASPLLAKSKKTEALTS